MIKHTLQNSDLPNASSDMKCTRMYLRRNIRVGGTSTLVQNIWRRAYKTSFEVPTPAVIHEPDKTSSEEIPDQDGEVCYQHVRHGQPHKLLQGGTQEDRSGQMGTCLLLSNNHSCITLSPTHLNPFVWPDSSWQRKDLRLWRKCNLSLSSINH